MKLKESWQDEMGNWTPEALRRMAMPKDHPNVVIACSEESDRKNVRGGRCEAWGAARKLREEFGILDEG
jgi:hypothetical protein